MNSTYVCCSLTDCDVRFPIFNLGCSAKCDNNLAGLVVDTDTANRLIHQKFVIPYHLISVAKLVITLIPLSIK